MMVVVRSMDYPGLLQLLRGKKVSLWSCGTCARICGMAGEENTVKLADRLGTDGVDVISMQTVGASCLQDRILAKADLKSLNASEAVVALCCDVGAETLAEVIDAEVINPVITLGQGSRDADGIIVVNRPSIKVLAPGMSMDEACEALSLFEGPFID